MDSCILYTLQHRSIRMKELIRQLDSLSILFKVILAIPALDLVWGIYRIVRAVDSGNTVGLVISIILLFVPFMWLIDIIFILFRGNVWYYA